MSEINISKNVCILDIKQNILISPDFPHFVKFSVVLLNSIPEAYVII